MAKTHYIATFTDGSVLTRSSGSTPSGKPYTHAWRVKNSAGDVVVSGFSGDRAKAVNAGSAASAFAHSRPRRTYEVAEAKVVDEDTMRTARGDKPKGYRIMVQRSNRSVKPLGTGRTTVKFTDKDQADAYVENWNASPPDVLDRVFVAPIWK